MAWMECAAALLVGVTAAIALQGTSNQEDPEAQAGVAEIRRLTREFVAGFNTGDLDRMMRFYADDYVDVNLRHPRQTKAERREYYRRLLERGEFRVEVNPDEIVVSGEYGFARGTILLHPSDAGGQAQPRELRYVEIWRKFPDGWKAIWGIDADIHPE